MADQAMKPSEIVALHASKRAERDASAQLAALEDVPALILAPDQDPVAVFLASRKSPRTRATMEEALRRIAHTLGPERNHREIPWNHLTFAHTSAIRAKLLRSHSPATVAVTVAALRGVLKTAWRLGLVPHEQYVRAVDLDAVAGSRMPSGRSLTDDEVLRLHVFALDQPDPYGVFLRALFAVLIGGGLRADEACSLTLSSYTANSRALRFVGKGDKEREVPLGDPECADIDAWIEARATLAKGTQWLFFRVGRARVTLKPPTRQVLEHMCTWVAKHAKLEPFSPHDCRRTFATRGLAKGLDLRAMQRLMGHESPETTARYDRAPAEADAKARRGVTLWG